MTLSPTKTHQLLKNLGHTPKKRLGQNFLVDGNIVQKSLELAQVNASDTVVEIGPGLGTLTAALLAKNTTVYAIEKDTILARHLRSTLSYQYQKTFHLTEGDAMDYPLAKLPTPSSFKIIANLPYSIATCWLESILRGPLPSDMVLMLQKEAADRFTASPGKHYGPISILTEAAYTRYPGHAVSKQCFYPVPQVDSVLLHLVKKEKPYSFNPDIYKLIRRLFTQRRKQIQSLCKQCFEYEPILNEWLDYLQSNNIPLNTRPEMIPLFGWMELNRLYLR